MRGAIVLVLALSLASVGAAFGPTLVVPMSSPVGVVRVATDVDDDPARVFGPVNTEYVLFDGASLRKGSQGPQEGAFDVVEFGVLNDAKFLLVGDAYLDLTAGDRVVVHDFEGRYANSAGQRVGQGELKLDGLGREIVHHDAETGETTTWPSSGGGTDPGDGTDPGGTPPPCTDCDGDGVPDDVDPCPTSTDCDGDGLPDGTDPCPVSPDCDGDGASDDVDPCPTTVSCGDDPCADGDCDGDDVPDDEDPCPTETDCDGDGLPDGVDPCATVVDCDGDGLPDGVDPCPTAVDCDGDGLPDGVDPCPASADCDGDGLPDDVDPCPTAADCDGDGLPDDVDPCPATVDCDGDGLADPEDPCATIVDCDGDLTPDPEDPCPTDPTCGARDTDRCGLADYEELEAGTDPADPSDDHVVRAWAERAEYTTLEDRPVVVVQVADALGRPAGDFPFRVRAAWRANLTAAEGVLANTEVFGWSVVMSTGADGFARVEHRGFLGITLPTLGHEQVFGEHVGAWHARVLKFGCPGGADAWYAVRLPVGDDLL